MKTSTLVNCCSGECCHPKTSCYHTFKPCMNRTVSLFFVHKIKEFVCTVHYMHRKHLVFEWIFVLAKDCAVHGALGQATLGHLIADLGYEESIEESGKSFTLRKHSKIIMVVCFRHFCSIVCSWSVWGFSAFWWSVFSQTVLLSDSWGGLLQEHFQVCHHLCLGELEDEGVDPCGVVRWSVWLELFPQGNRMAF